MFQRNQVMEGMTVRSIDGEKLGKVFALGDDAFHIEKGLFFPKDYLVRYADISDIRDGELILMHGRESLLRLSSEGKSGTATGYEATAGQGTGATATDWRADTSASAATTARRTEEATSTWRTCARASTGSTSWRPSQPGMRVTLSLMLAGSNYPVRNQPPEPWHRLNFLPLLQGHGSLRPTFP
jgi:hypothetical protein